MLTRENIICCITSILLIAYLVVTFILCNNSAAAATAPADSPVIITVAGGETNRFVTPNEVRRLITPCLLPAGNPIVASRVNTLEMEHMLNAVDNIESARCSRTSADRILVEVVPMKPVARVFDGSRSFYINRAGKQLSASLRYRSDVPVIQGHLESAADARRLMPLLDTIAARPELRELVTSIRLTDGPDVMLIPSIRGHIVNFGLPDTDISDKFRRLLTMYRRVMPVKGWDYYDTISVKFARQIVATRRSPAARPPVFITDTEGDADEEKALAGSLPPAGAVTSAPAPSATPSPSATPAPEAAAAPQAATTPPAVAAPQAPDPAPQEQEPIIVIEQ